jgi:hypothetical protein
MTAKHARPPVRPASSKPRELGVRGRRIRLLIVVLAPLVALVPLTARATEASHAAAANKAGKAGSAGTASTASKVAAHLTAPKAVAKAAQPAVAAKRLQWSRSWNSGLALLSDYQPGVRSKAGFLALPYTYDVGATQEAIATARFKTNWVDVKALKDGPNISQQGLSVQPQQYKLQIMHGATPASHRANCHIAGATGHVLAFGPNIDVADGNWHTVTCIKYPDGASGTKVVVIVDGVAGHAAWSRTPIGNVKPTGALRLGGRSSLASSDSLDGWISSLSYWLLG